MNNIIPRGDNYLYGDYYQSHWEKSGVLEADCLICHLKGYNWKNRALAVRGGFLYEAPMVGAGWFRDLKVSNPALPSDKPEAHSFGIDYTQTNIAELINALEYAFVTCSERVIDISNIPDTVLYAEGIKLPRPHSGEDDPIKMQVLAALKQANGEKKKAAEILGISRQALWNRIRKYGIEVKKTIILR